MLLAKPVPVSVTVVDALYGPAGGEAKPTTVGAAEVYVNEFSSEPAVLSGFVTVTVVKPFAKLGAAAGVVAVTKFPVPSTTTPEQTTGGVIPLLLPPIVTVAPNWKPVPLT
jgi:hypothetical protein